MCDEYFTLFRDLLERKNQVLDIRDMNFNNSKISKKIYSFKKDILSNF